MHARAVNATPHVSRSLWTELQRSTSVIHHQIVFSLQNISLHLPVESKSKYEVSILLMYICMYALCRWMTTMISSVHRSTASRSVLRKFADPPYRPSAQ